MIIADQISLFFRKFRQASTNSNLEPGDALDYINESRETEAAETRFYDVKDTITAVGGETEWTLLDTFLGLDGARDSVTCNGIPVVMKTLADWAEFISGQSVVGIDANTVYGMLHGNTFYRYPAAQAGDVMVWWGAALPPALPAVTGPDAYLNNIQARVTVYGAVIDALEDNGEQPGQVLVAKYARLKKLIIPKAGPRLENAPED